MNTQAQIDIENMDEDLLEEIKADLKTVEYDDDDGTGTWYVVRKLGGLLAVKEDGTPIIAMSHETAYNIGYNIGLYDCLWWCPMRVDEYERIHG